MTKSNPNCQTTANTSEVSQNWVGFGHELELCHILVLESSNHGEEGVVENGKRSSTSSSTSTSSRSNGNRRRSNLTAGLRAT